MTDELLPAEIRAYQEAGQKERYAMPDIEQRLNARRDEGFEIHPTAVVEIVRRRRPDYQRYLATENGKADLRDFTNVANSPRRSLETVNRNLARFDRHKPFEEYRPEIREEDKWIAERREARRTGKRR